MERKIYTMHDSSTDSNTLLSLTLDQVALIDFFIQNNCLDSDISFTKLDISNPEIISGTEWYDYMGD